MVTLDGWKVIRYTIVPATDHYLPASSNKVHVSIIFGLVGKFLIYNFVAHLYESTGRAIAVTPASASALALASASASALL